MDESERGAGAFGRRAFLAAAAGVVTGLAGCSEATRGDRSTATADGGGGAPTLMTGDRPSIVDFGPSTQSTGGHLLGFLHALVLPVDGSTGEHRTSGHTVTVGGRELTVPCVISDVEVDAEDDSVTLTTDDRLTYWNGEPLDARAYWLRDRVEWHATYGDVEDRPFEGELVSDTEYRRAVDAAVANPLVPHPSVHPGPPPLPPSYTEQWVEQFEDATTGTAVRNAYGDYVRGRLDAETFVEDGLGSGRYAVESTDDITEEAIDLPVGMQTNTEVLYLTERPDHPGSASVPRFRLVCGAGGISAGVSGSIAGVGGSAPVYDANVFANYGNVDLAAGGIGPGNADFAPGPLPDPIEQATTYPSPAAGGQQLLFNWENDHLRRLWVRRAVVAAAPLALVRDNGGGRAAVSPTHDAGMLSRADERAFDASFLDSLYDYPVERDEETAAEWLREAGYDRQGGEWVGPDGDRLGLTLLSFSAQYNSTRAIADSLQSFGVGVDFEQIRRFEYPNYVNGGEFDLLLASVPGGRSPVQFYGDWFSTGEGWTATSPITVAGNPLGSCTEEPPMASVPASVTLPEEPGAIRIEGVDYGDGGAAYEWDAGETVSVCEAIERLRTADEAATAREAARVCARWYNYAVPNVVFRQRRAGVWAHTGRLSLPLGDGPAATGARGEPVVPEHYHLQAGTVTPVGES